LLLGGIIAAGLLITLPLWAWLVVMLLLVLSMIIAGHGIRRLWRGLLIDERQQLSLSRLQLVLWTILILSGFLTAMLANLNNAAEDPLAVAIPPELWAALGISITSLVGSPLIRKPKKDRTEDQREFERTRMLAMAQGIPGADKAVNEGQIVEKLDPRDSSFGDMLRGEEVGNWASLDIGKLSRGQSNGVMPILHSYSSDA
jgi:hypothetical protein